MKAITLYQPYASAIAFGLKRFETRSWSVSYRGEIAIHAGKSKNGFGDMDILIKPKDLEVEYYYDLPFGAIVATANLAGVYIIKEDEDISRILSPTYGYGESEGEVMPGIVDVSLGDWSIGRHIWKLENIKRLKTPVPTRGKQGLWNWERNNLGERASLDRNGD